MDEKSSISQIDPQTGISHDYRNEIGGVMNRIRDPSYRGSLKQLRIRTYTERYDPEIYADVINDKNRAGISRLDEIVNEMNKMLSDPETFDVEEMTVLARKAGGIIHPSHRK